MSCDVSFVYFIEWNLIGVTLSEPHTCEVCIFEAIRPTNQDPAAANFLINGRKYSNFLNNF